MLIGARFIQGVGGALTSAVILGMIVTMFRSRASRRRRSAIYSFVASAGASIGLLAGGALTQAINWHWIFFVNVPIGVATALLALRLLVADDKGLGLGKGADVLGALLVTAALMLGVYTIVKAAEHGWASAQTLGFGAVVARAAGRVRRAPGAARDPLVPLRVFRSRNVSGANVIQMLMVAGLFGMFFLGTLYLQRVLGYDALEIGLAFLPVSLAHRRAVARRLRAAGMRFGPREVLLAGLVSIAAGLALFAQVPVDGDYVADLLPVDGPARRRRGPVVPGADDARDVGRDAGDAGLASGLVNTTHAGRRRARPRRPRHAGDVAHRGAARRRRVAAAALTGGYLPQRAASA